MQVSARATELARERAALVEKKRAVTFLKNQVQSAEEEAQRGRSNSDASGVAAAGGGAAQAGAAAAEEDGGDNQDCCRICLEPYDDRVITKCMHSFCGVCIGEYIKMSGARSNRATCPICREPIQESELQKVSAPVLQNDDAAAAASDRDGNSAKLTYLVKRISEKINEAVRMQLNANTLPCMVHTCMYIVMYDIYLLMRSLYYIASWNLTTHTHTHCGCNS